ncbi:MAG: Smr/MutS family protein [Nitrospirae bacterium]|nr:Smr/MutS family protein [Nitrospirota bacterium]
MIDESTVKILEFEKILEMASAFAVTQGAKESLLSRRPFRSPGDMCHSVDHVSEWRGLMAENKQGGIEEFDDLNPQFNRLRPEHAILDPLELRRFIPLFDSAMNLKRLADEISYPIISHSVSALYTHKHVRRAIDDAIENDGHIADKASPELASIRKKLVSYEKRIRHTLEQFLEHKELQPHIQDKFLTERKGRWVIPVKKDSRGHLPGVVHDISNTGETLFVEPFETQHMGNDMESLKAEEKMEEYKVLKKLAATLREKLVEIESDYRIATTLDSFVAMARFSGSMGMNAPEINENRRISIIEGCHPLLWRSLARHGKDGAVVPLNFELGGEYSNMVITGSNAGGKTVALKTIGVIHLMALSGMHVPAKSGTSIPFVEKLFVDIGDDQSIEENLSTFSAHISRITSILNGSGPDTLVLLDELGTGTDPEEGGALACATLRYLSAKGSLSVITTHLKQVKVFAFTEPGMRVGTMDIEMLDVEGIKVFHPTYRLVMGELGQSYAFEIAGHYGLPREIVEEARGFLKESETRLETLVADIREKTNELDGKLKEANILRDEVLRTREILNRELAASRNAKKDILLKAYNEAGAIVSDLKSEAREILQSLKKADSQKARETVVIIDRKMASILDKKRAMQRDGYDEYGDGNVARKLVEGQKVVLRGHKAKGIILSVNEKKDRCTVLINDREVEVPLSEVLRSEVMHGKDEIKGTARSTSSVGLNSGKADGRNIDDIISSSVPLELNIVGQRVDPALSLVEQYLNDAAMDGIDSVRIIHGLGTGTLARAVREYLSTHPLVHSFRKGTKEDGGEAVTIVVL